MIHSVSNFDCMLLYFLTAFKLHYMDFKILKRCFHISNDNIYLVYSALISILFWSNLGVFFENLSEIALIIKVEPSTDIQ